MTTDNLKIFSHKTFGGIIYPSDFEIIEDVDNSNGSVIAIRILNDQIFDARCKRNKEIIEEHKNGRK